jgi:DHA1 family tetracycline resistance protein-like MFS transporter
VKREKLIIIGAVLVDVIGFGIVIPILPFYVQEFSSSPTTVTMLFAAFSLCAFVSAPFLGALSDRIGRRPVLILSICSTAVGWLVFASATSVAFLFVGRIIDGAAAGNFTTAQSYLVDISKDDKERSANLGVIGAVFGVGFMLGPVLGGVLSKFGHATPFWFAGGLAALNATLAFFFLPETHHHRNEKPLSINPLAPLIRAANDTRARPLYISWAMFALSFTTSQAVFALFVRKNFGFDSFTTGMTFTAVGLVVAVNQVVLLKRFWLHRFSEYQLEVIMISGLMVGALMVATKSLALFAISLLLAGTGQSVLRVVLTSQIAGTADQKTKGEKLGILSSLMAAMMFAGPILAGPMFEWNDTLPYFAGAAYLSVGLWTAVRAHRATASVVAEPL